MKMTIPWLLEATSTSPSQCLETGHRRKWCAKGINKHRHKINVSSCNLRERRASMHLRFVYFGFGSNHAPFIQIPTHSINVVTPYFDTAPPTTARRVTFSNWNKTSSATLYAKALLIQSNAGKHAVAVTVPCVSHSIARIWDPLMIPAREEAILVQIDAPHDPCPQLSFHSSLVHF
jgi:hypothetical protein